MARKSNADMYSTRWFAQHDDYSIKEYECTSRNIERRLHLLGRDIATARRRSRILQRLLAERMMVSLDTVQRLERGDPGIGLGVVVTAPLGHTPRALL
jgi:DNA-binding transcriptional regulator YiaG